MNKILSYQEFVKACCLICRNFSKKLHFCMKKVLDFCESINLLGSREIFFLPKRILTNFIKNVYWSENKNLFLSSRNVWRFSSLDHNFQRNYNYSQWHFDFNWFKIFLFSIWKQVKTLIAKWCPKNGEYRKESSHKEKYLSICKCE